MRRSRRFSTAREEERMKEWLGIGSVIALGAARTIPAIRNPQPDPIAPPGERP
jgi:hypothetical protein